MSQLDIIRAWKDDEYCNSLSDEQRAMLPDNPAGIVELTDEQLHDAAGGTITLPICYSYPFFTCLTFCITITFAELPAADTQT